MTESTQPTTSTQDQEGFLLSGQQERLWNLFSESAPSAQCAIGLSGAIDPAALREALEAAVDRHEILRTSFVRPAGLRAPLQVVRESGSLVWSSEDCGGLDGGQLETRLAELSRAQRETSFDLEDGPHLSAVLVSKEDGHVLILTASSLALDARSLFLLAREALGEPSADEPLQYGDYAAWQQEQREGLPAEPAAEADPRPQTAFPLAPCPDAPSPGPASELKISLPEGAAAAIGKLAGSPREAWLALWSVLVARMCGQTEVGIDVRSAGRAQDELDGALGPYARPLPVRLEIERAATLEQVLAEVTRELGEAERDQELRTATTAPAGAVGFAFVEVSDGFEAGGVKGEVLDLSENCDALQVTLDVRSRPNGVELTLRHDQVVPESEARRIAAHLETLITSAVEADGGAAAWQLDILGPEQRGHLLEELSGRGVPSAGETPVQSLIEESVSRAPDAPAVNLGDESLTYAQLNDRANRLAHELRAEGVGPGSTVSILLDRSLELIVSVLAVMKSGGAYLPLNPDHPLERLDFQLTDAEASLILTDEALAGQAAELNGRPLRVDSDFSDRPADNPEPAGAADDVAYVIYTSGSTGVPKGVEVTRRGLASYLAGILDRFEFASGEPLRFGVVTTMSTDLGNTSVFSALASGGCLELVPVEAAMDGESFAAHVESRPLDVLKITPSHLAALLASDQGGVLPGRWLILGGEAAPWQLIEQVRSHGSCAIVNHYGPTETTVGSLTYDVGEQTGAAARAATVPIGRPLPGTDVYVVDEECQPVPVGAPGELLIGGPGLARGYRNQAEQTAERFISHPFSNEPEARVYRTGDIVRYLADGNIEFLGREDGQVKIRGFRIELSEIEAVLSEHASVSRMAVVMREEPNGEGRLVAYVVGNAPVDDLRASARERLPDYMVPAAFVTLAALPLTPNGKLDHAALPAPPTTGGSSREYVAPSNEIEERLAAIWAEALEVDRVGVQDDFFELGGHSLLAAQVIARIRNAYEVQLPLHSLFTAPRVADLAAEVAAVREPAEGDDAELTSLLEDLEGLTDEEAERLLQLESSDSEGQSRNGSE